jgi:hypothetical protein
MDLCAIAPCILSNGGFGLQPVGIDASLRAPTARPATVGHSMSGAEALRAKGGAHGVMRKTASLNNLPAASATFCRRR